MILKILLAITFVAAVVSISIGGLLIVRRIKYYRFLRQNHDITDPMMAITGTLFSVLIGFLVVGAMNRFHEAREGVNKEANDVASIFRVARGLPTPERYIIRDTCRDYCQVVVDDEWPLMEQGKTSGRAWAVYQQLWDECLSFIPADDRQSNLHDSIMSSMKDLGESRRTRVAALNYWCPTILWIVVLMGCVSIVLFTYLLCGRGLFVQCVNTGLIAFGLSLNLVLLHVFSRPFTGLAKLAPRDFQVNLVLFKQADEMPPVWHDFQEYYKDRQDKAQ